MTPEAVVRGPWDRFETRGWDGAGEFLAEDLRAAWRASGESFAGRDAYVHVNRIYPGNWHAVLDEIAPPVTASWPGSPSPSTGFPKPASASTGWPTARSPTSTSGGSRMMSPRSGAGTLPPNQSAPRKRRPPRPRSRGDVQCSRLDYSRVPRGNGGAVPMSPGAEDPGLTPITPLKGAGTAGIGSDPSAGRDGRQPSFSRVRRCSPGLEPGRGRDRVAVPTAPMNNPG